jgi:hypothetical protein
VTPVCPPGYTCTFTKIPEPKLIHLYAHWWDGPWGQWVALVAIVAMAAVLATVAIMAMDIVRARGQAKRKAVLDAENKRHELAMAEQLTMLADACQGNPDMWKIVKEQTR